MASLIARFYLRRSQSSSVSARAAAAQKLANRCEPDVVSRLIELLRDPDVAVRRDAASSLAHCCGQPDFFELGKSDRSAVADASASALHDADPIVRRYAVRALGHTGWGSMIHELTHALDDSDATVREEALNAIAGNREASASPAFGRIAALDEGKRGDFAREYYKLGNLATEEERVIAKLAAGDFERLDEHADLAVPLLGAIVEQRAKRATNAIQALGRIRTPDAFRVLASAVRSWETSAAAWRALDDAGDASYGTIQLLLRDPTADVRINAVTRCLNIVGTRAVEPLRELLHDPEPSVRGAAARALRSLPDEALDERTRIRVAIALDDFDAAVAVGATAIELLAEVPEYSVGAARALAQLGDERGFDRLLAIASSSERKEQSLQAALALNALGDKRANDVLHQRASDSFDAACALAAHGDLRCLEPLLFILAAQDKRSDAAAAAIGSLEHAAVGPLVGIVISNGDSPTARAAQRTLLNTRWSETLAAEAPRLTAAMRSMEFFADPFLKVLARVGDRAALDRLMQTRPSDEEHRNCLLSLMDRWLEELDEQTLTRLSQMPDSTKSIYSSSDYSWDHGTWETLPFSNESVRVLASMELQRRSS